MVSADDAPGHACAAAGLPTRLPATAGLLSRCAATTRTTSAAAAAAAVSAPPPPNDARERAARVWVLLRYVLPRRYTVGGCGPDARAPASVFLSHSMGGFYRYYSRHHAFSPDLNRSYEVAGTVAVPPSFIHEPYTQASPRGGRSARSDRVEDLRASPCTRRR